MNSKTVPEHAAMRARKRYGIRLTDEARLDILARIRADDVTRKRFLAATSRWEIRMHVAGRPVDLIVDGDITEIITFLPSRKARAKQKGKRTGKLRGKMKR